MSEVAHKELYLILYFNFSSKNGFGHLSSNVVSVFYIMYCLFLFILFYFHISHLGTYHGNGKRHIQYTHGITSKAKVEKYLSTTVITFLS